MEARLKYVPGQRKIINWLEFVGRLGVIELDTRMCLFVYLCENARVFVRGCARARTNMYLVNIARLMDDTEGDSTDRNTESVI